MKMIKHGGISECFCFHLQTKSHKVLISICYKPSSCYFFIPCYKQSSMTTLQSLYGVFNDAATDSDYKTLNDRLISQQLIRKYLEGSGHCIICSTILEFALRNWRRLAKLHDNLRFVRDLNQVLSEFNAETLPLEAKC
jgi:hypothetical protein